MKQAFGPCFLYVSIAKEGAGIGRGRGSVGGYAATARGSTDERG